MRAALLILALLLAGCADPAGSDATPPTSADTTPSGSPMPTPSATPPPTPTTPDDMHLGVVLDESHDFSAGGQKMSFFNVTGGESKVVIDIASAGPPADGSFQSAVVNFYFPGSTSPFLGELPGAEQRNFTVEQQPHQGMWRVVYDGAGKTSVGIRVTLH